MGHTVVLTVIVWCRQHLPDVRPWLDGEIPLPVTKGKGDLAVSGPSLKMYQLL
jgi:hypothetical protein